MGPNEKRLYGPVGRRGLAATETAITLPLLVLLVFGAIELTNAIFLKQSLTIAAYEGARAVARPAATSDNGEARVDAVLAARGVSNYEVSFSPEVTASTPRGTTLKVTVSAPVAAHLVGPVWFFGERTMMSEVCMVRL